LIELLEKESEKPPSMVKEELYGHTCADNRFDGRPVGGLLMAKTALPCRGGRSARAFVLDNLGDVFLHVRSLSGNQY
jgi:hypothetical protein